MVKLKCDKLLKNNYTILLLSQRTSFSCCSKMELDATYYYVLLPNYHNLPS